MDPNETLRLLRKMASDTGGGFGEAFEDLDEWLTKGGALPTAWDHNIALDRWLVTVVTDGEHETSTHATEQSAWLYLFETMRGDIAEWLDPDVLSYDDAKAAVAVDGLFDSEKMNDVREALAEAGIDVYVDAL